MSTQCHCLTKKKKRCTKSGSRNPRENSNFCYLHQNCPLSSQVDMSVSSARFSVSPRYGTQLQPQSIAPLSPYITQPQSLAPSLQYRTQLQPQSIAPLSPYITQPQSFAPSLQYRTQLQPQSTAPLSPYTIVPLSPYITPQYGTQIQPQYQQTINIPTSVEQYIRQLNLSKDTLRLIALNLDGQDLLNFCLTNKQFSVICKDETFWRYKLMKDFIYWFKDKPNNYIGSDWYKNLYKQLYMYPPGADYDWGHILTIDGNPFQRDERPITNMAISSIGFDDEPINIEYINEFNEFVNNINPNNFIEDKRRTNYLLYQIYSKLREMNIVSGTNAPNTLMIQTTPQFSGLHPNDQIYLISFVNGNIRLEYGNLPDYQFIALYESIGDKLPRCYILGVEQSHPFIYSNNFSYGNSDGSGPDIIYTTPTSVDIFNGLKSYFNTFANDEFHESHESE